MLCKQAFRQADRWQAGAGASVLPHPAGVSDQSQPPARFHDADFALLVAAEMADSEQLVAVKITPLYPEEDRNMFHIMAAATAMDVAVGGCLAECGAHVPNRVMHRVSRTTYCDMTNGFCECAAPGRTQHIPIHTHTLQ